MPVQELMRHCKNLCACKTVAQAANMLASCMRESGSAFASGIFLTDYSGEQFILTGRDPLPIPENSQEFKMIPLAAMDDPVSYCAHRGIPGYLRNNLTPAPVSLQTMLPLNVEMVSSLSTYPLIAPGGHIVGVAVMAQTSQAIFPEGFFTTLCFYGSAIIHSLIGSGRNSMLVQSLQQDLERIRQKQNSKDEAFDALVGESMAMRQLKETAAKVAASDAPIIITGETGTGKSFLAKLIHKASARKNGPFMEINCGSIPESLLESELFGYVKGSFSGAATDHPGLFRSSNGGTVFLDEIGEMPVQLQAKLLQVLQELQVRPVGSASMHPVDIRIIAATNKDLASAMQMGDFRPDLYHRISVVEIKMPPLSERKEDILPLVSMFFDKYKKQYNKNGLKIDRKSLHQFYAHPFPGNIRELSSIIERGVMLSDSSSGEICFFDEDIQDGMHASKGIPTLADFVMRQEKEFINSVYTLYAGDIRKCGEMLGIHPKTVARKIRQFAQKD